MFLVRAFRAHQREPVPIRLVNVDMTPEQRFPELTLQQEIRPENSDFLKLKDKVLEIELFIAIKTTGLAHTNFIVISWILI